MSNKLYTTIPAPKVPRNVFHRNRPNSLTMHFQKCVPTMVEEIIPGDQYTVGTETFARLQPLIAPVMNNMKISQHFFFVPLRTLNRHFSEFMFNNRTGDYSEVLPYCYTDDLYSQVQNLYEDESFEIAANVIRLFDFIGLPFRYKSVSSGADLFVYEWLNDIWNTGVSASHLRVNLLPFFAYTKIWSEYFRDENVMEDPFIYYENLTENSVFSFIGDSSNYIDMLFSECFFQLRPRAWQHDRFTSSLPFAQRGPDVLLPIAGTLPVVPGTAAAGQSGVTGTVGYSQLPREDGQFFTTKDSETIPISLEANFDNAALTTTINSFRRAERLQRWYENDARGGTRPNEGTLAHFGVRTPDATLDRAEFLGGSMQPIVVSEVAQTSETTQSSPQATLAGKGTSYNGTFGFKRFFTEHGFVFCFTSALCRANYWQGIPRVFSRMQREEYYWPEFANLGEEPVFTKELFAGSDVNEDDTFGYVPRYSDYKSAQGEVHGDMRSSMAFWTQTREFENTPQLNEEFIFGNPDLSPFAVQSPYSDPIICTINFNVRASRLMPFYGVPTI